MGHAVKKMSYIWKSWPHLKNGSHCKKKANNNKKQTSSQGMVLFMSINGPIIFKAHICLADSLRGRP